MKSVVCKLLFAIGTSVACLSALGVPVTWNLSGVAFDDGATASGSFVFDADTNQYSSVNIITTPGSHVGATFRFVCTPCKGFSTGDPSARAVVLMTASQSDPFNNPFLHLSFASPLSNAGGDRSVSGQQTGNGGAGRAIVRGIVNAVVAPPAPVPTLSQMSLAALALLIAFAFAFRFRQTRRA